VNPQLAGLFDFFSVVFRAATLVFQSLLLGGVLFALWVARGSTNTPEDNLEIVRRSSLRLLRASALGLAVAQVLYLYVNSTVLMGTAEIGFRDVVGANFFLAASCMLIAAVMTVAVVVMPEHVRAAFLPLLALAVLSASLVTNHAASRLDNRPLLIALTATHELATGFWIGGLPFLILGLFKARDGQTRLYLAERFSRIAVVSVVALIFSGVSLSVAFIGSWHAVLGTSYGVMVTAKAFLLLVLLLLGGINFLLIRTTRVDFAMPRLRRLIDAEVGIGITVILTAASLTSQPPAVDLVNNIATPQQIFARLKPKWPGFSYPQPASVHSSAVFASTTPVATDTSAARNVDGVLLSAKDLMDIERSDANHHWMGLIVLAMGILALLSRTGKFPWAEYWPVLLVSIAIWIFLRADPESWPYGPDGFWATWMRAEVFQHRLAGIVCVLFAAFELRVRKLNLQSSRQSFIFPLMCAVGGVVLLAHSHSVTNVKEQLLVELNHVPMGVLAVLAGWSRWLELRLPSENRRVPSWIWPICFVLIGAGLINYREM